MKKILLALGFGVAAGVGGAMLMDSGAPNGQAHARDSRAAYDMLQLLGDIFNRVDDAYVEEVDQKELIEAAINGMLTSLDPHSGYLPPQAASEMQQETQGKFGGLGIEVTMEDGYVKVVTPIDDTPAQRAGLKSGDYITHLDGEGVLGMTLSDAVKRMRGAPGEKISLTIAREGEEEPLQIDVVRAVITILPVKARAIGDIGVLRITKFNRQTTGDLEKKIAELKGDIGDKLKGFVLDLRNNPGGLLDQAISVTDTFLDKGAIVSTRGRALDQAEHHNATKGDLTKGLPMVVLINNGSASAAEIVAGALQDHRRAIIVGTKSFGKGSVQTIIRLRNDAAIRLTTSRYYTPSGRSIQALGIEPDILVEQLDVKKKEKSQRPQRSEATLRGHLDNPDEPKPEEKAAAKGKKGDKKDAKKQGKERLELRTSDYQLSYALDLLDGVAAIAALKQE